MTEDRRGSIYDDDQQDTSVLIDDIIRTVNTAVTFGNRPQPLPTPSTTFTTAATSLDDATNAD